MCMRSTLAVVTLCCISTTVIAGEEVALDEKADGTTVRVRCGRRVVISLPGNITTGYSWELDGLTGDSLRQVGDIKYIPDKPIIPGSGGTFVATFRAVEEGESVVSMVYRRPWEKDKPPLKTFEVTIKVVRRADVTADHCVNVADLLSVCNNLGKADSKMTPPCVDVDENGICNVADLLIVRNALGRGNACEK